jgi:single-strand DNA-binding protein
MAADNHTTIVGNLVDDPELRFTGNGTAVANLRVAVTQRIQQDGEWRDGDTSFLRVNVWRGQAEHLVESLGKGDRVMVTGRLRQRTWETPEGEKRSVTEIEADEVGASLKWATAKVERTPSAATESAPNGGSGRPNAPATSPTRPHSEQPSVGALGSSRGRRPTERLSRCSPAHATLPSRPTAATGGQPPSLSRRNVPTGRERGRPDVAGRAASDRGYSWACADGGAGGRSGYSTRASSPMARPRMPKSISVWLRQMSQAWSRATRSP